MPARYIITLAGFGAMIETGDAGRYARATIGHY